MKGMNCWKALRNRRLFLEKLRSSMNDLVIAPCLGWLRSLCENFMWLSMTVPSSERRPSFRLGYGLTDSLLCIFNTTSQSEHLGQRWKRYLGCASLWGVALGAVKSSLGYALGGCRATWHQSVAVVSGTDLPRLPTCFLFLIPSPAFLTWIFNSKTFVRVVISCHGSDPKSVTVRVYQRKTREHRQATNPLIGLGLPV